MGLLQAREEGTRKITVSLLSRLVFWIHLRKSLTLFESKAFQWTLLSLPEQRMWPSEPSPLAMEILPIRIRISRFAANFELERVIWGRRMQNKMLTDSLSFEQGQPGPPPSAQKKLYEIRRPSLKKQREHWLGFWVVRTWRSHNVIKEVVWMGSDVCFLGSQIYLGQGNFTPVSHLGTDPSNKSQRKEIQNKLTLWLAA